MIRSFWRLIVGLGFLLLLADNISIFFVCQPSLHSFGSKLAAVIGAQEDRGITLLQDGGQEGSDIFGMDRECH